MKGVNRAERIRIVQQALPRWYRRRSRDLPWRRTRDPYAIWVSEIMLQQTRVDQARPYYERFMRRFPRVGHLARAPLDEVLKVWEGMGYYTRARNLHRAAKRILETFGGKVPDSVEALRSLPGVGAYTAGAVASIAFGRDEPVLDGNVARVLCRLFAVAGDPRSGAVRNKLWSLARRMIPPGRAGPFNQALMDLGAMVCRPRKPACRTCPLREACLARARAVQERYPFRTPRKPAPHHTVAAGVIRKRGWLLICRRRPDGLLGGLWEFPGGKVERGETLEKALKREIREEVDLRVKVDRPLVVVDHAYTHFRITLHVFLCTWQRGKPMPKGCAAVRWVRMKDLDRFAFPAANRRIIEALGSLKP